MVSVTWRPSRSTTIGTSPAGAALMAACSSVHVVTGVPATERIVSPTRRPPAVAGDFVDGAHVPLALVVPSTLVAVGVHGTTAPTVVVAAWMPMPHSTIVNRMNARIRFIVGPPSMTTIRLRTGSL